MKTMFVCSNYRGRVSRNREKARQYARQVVICGYIPVAPHLFYPQFLDDLNPEERLIGINLGIEQLKTCDEMWIFGSQISEGMALEIEKAREYDIPVRLYDENGKALNQELLTVDERVNEEYRERVKGLRFA